MPLEVQQQRVNQLKTDKDGSGGEEWRKVKGRLKGQKQESEEESTTQRD